MMQWQGTFRIMAAASVAAVMGMAVADGHARERQTIVTAQVERDTRADEMRQGAPMTYLIDFRDSNEPSRWRAINDGVMGGVSQGSLTVEDGIGIFSGETSLENNGGFASVRRDPEAFDLGLEAGIALHVRGDGRAYQLRLYTDQLPQGAAYRASFQPSSREWQRVTLPWHDFKPMFRGRLLEGIPPIDPAAIEQVGLMIVDRKAGPFRLEVAWLATP